MMISFDDIIQFLFKKRQQEKLTLFSPTKMPLSKFKLLFILMMTSIKLILFVILVILLIEKKTTFKDIINVL